MSSGVYSVPIGTVGSAATLVYATTMSHYIMSFSSHVAIETALIPLAHMHKWWRLFSDRDASKTSDPHLDSKMSNSAPL